MITTRKLLVTVALGMVIVASPASAKIAKVLVLGDDGGVANDTAILNDLTGTDNRFNHVKSDAYDLSSGLPTASFLAGFDSVLVFTNAVSVDLTSLSDLLGSYVHNGGGVVISTFWGQQAGSAGGLLNSTGYNPLINPTSDAYNSQTLGTFNAADPLMKGVTTLTSSYYNGITYPG